MTNWHTAGGRRPSGHRAASLRPHGAQPMIEALEQRSIPTIFLTLEVFRDTQYLIAAAGQEELAWLGAVQEVSEETYVIDRVFLFEQVVGWATCEITPQALGAFYAEELAQHPENRSLLERIRFWGHLHPEDVEPSRQDEEQMKLFADAGWFLRGIFTRQGHARFTFFDYRRKLKIVDCPWSLYLQAEEDPERQETITEEVRQKVRRMAPQLPGGSYGPHVVVRKKRRRKKRGWLFGSGTDATGGDAAGGS